MNPTNLRKSEAQITVPIKNEAELKIIIQHYR